VAAGLAHALTGKTGLLPTASFNSRSYFKVMLTVHKWQSIDFSTLPLPLCCAAGQRTEGHVPSVEEVPSPGRGSKKQQQAAPTAGMQKEQE
jgi:hypothetical protein